MGEPGPNADPRFVQYYQHESASGASQLRFDSARRAVLAVRQRIGLPTAGLDVVDVGCGPGAQALLWAKEGHRVIGIDISEPLIETARERAEQSALDARFLVGTATDLPVDDQSFDVVLLSELLEHTSDWEHVLSEGLRVLRPGGIIYLSTTNRLCPVQSEFDLPAYSWYPGWVKKRCERLAVTTHGHWVQYATFPAVHWFSFYQLRAYLDRRGFTAYDRFDVMEVESSALRKFVVGAVQRLPPLRFLAQMMTPYTLVVAYRRD